MTQLVFFAHATTIDNELGNATGWLPGKLSGVGVGQAKALALPLKKHGFDIIFTSDLARSINTALLAIGHDIDTRADWRLREANYGDHNGTPKSFKSSMEEFISTPYPNGECYEDTEARVRSFVNDIKGLYPDKKICVIGHEATQLAIEVVVNNKSWEQVVSENWRKTGDWKPGWNYTLS